MHEPSISAVRVVLDNDGNIVNQISYDSFGQITNQTNPDASFRFSYTGREFDAETGQYYYRARYYDPSVGKFISEDPIGFAAGDSNIYRYVGNNPLFYVDPTGFCGVASSGGDGGEPEFFGPGFGPNFTPSPNGDDNENEYDILAGTTIANPKSALAAAFAALAVALHILNETSPETQRRREEFDEFRNQGDESQPLETTVGDNSNEFNPNNINKDGESQLDIPNNTGDSSPANSDLEGQTGAYPNVEPGTIENTGSNEDNSNLPVDRFDVDKEVTDSKGNPIFGPGYISNDFPVNDSQTRHILRDRSGHIPDTPENRKILRDVANDYRNYNGSDKHGTSWFSKTLSNGQQIWVKTRDGIINNAGINEPGNVRTYNPETGLSRQKPPKGN